MARGRHYAKLSLSNAARLSFSDLCILLFMFLSLCRLCVCVFLCSHWSLVDVPLIFFCPADHVPDWQPRVLLGMVEARSVNVKKTTTTTTVQYREFNTDTSKSFSCRRLSNSAGSPVIIIIIIIAHSCLTPHTSHLTPHTSHLTPHTSHLTPHTHEQPCQVNCSYHCSAGRQETYIPAP